MLDSLVNNYKLWIFDRDGVINKKAKYPKRYILDISDLKINADVLSFIVSLQQQKKYLAVATNQQCIGKGLINDFDLQNIHSEIDSALILLGGNRLEYFVCGHLKIDKCKCRKPQPGLLEQILDKFSIELKDAIFIGDSTSDFIAARKAGINFINFKRFINELRDGDPSVD